jgi:hypothetical protein
MSKYAKYKDRIKELLQEDKGFRDIARKLQSENEELKSSNVLNIAKGVEYYKNQFKAEEPNKFDQYLDDIGVSKGKVTAYWDKTSKEYSTLIAPNRISEDDLVERFEEVLDRINLKQYQPPKKRKKSTSRKALKAVRTDCHIGMNPNPRGKSLFQYEYNGDIYRKNTEIMFQDILKERELFGKFEVLFLEDLGDRADGWNGFTTRGGHELPQNMTNDEVFDVAVETEVELIEKIIKHDIADKVIVRAVGNDNHSGDFGKIINKAVKKIIDKVYSKDFVEVITMTRFIDHYTYGDHAFLLTHGKDESVMKFGMPLHLNEKTINFINDYIDHYEIDSKYIHLQKGDLHQVGYNRVKKFDYRNFMSFAPPSSWVQGNFGDCYSGYSLQIIEKDKQEIKHIDKFFDMKKIFKNQ